MQLNVIFSKEKIRGKNFIWQKLFQFIYIKNFVFDSWKCLKVGQYVVQA